MSKGRLFWWIFATILAAFIVFYPIYYMATTSQQ